MYNKTLIIIVLEKNIPDLQAQTSDKFNPK